MRERAKLTQEQVALLSRGEVSQATLSRLECGETTNPTMATLQALAKAYRVSAVDVLKAITGTRKVA